MTTRDSTPPSAPPAPHWIVGTHYRVRGTSFAFAGILTTFTMWTQYTPAHLWVFLAFLFFIYPHLAYGHARRSADSRQAEFTNLNVDTVLLGVWTGLLGWPLWFTFMLSITCTVNRVLVFGIRSSVGALAVFFGVGALAWFGWPDGRFRLAENQIEVIYLCAIGTFVYLLGVAQIAHRRTASLRKARHELQDRIHDVESLQSQLLEQAVRDPLTQLYNRRHFDPSLQREWARCERQEQCMSLMVIDIDHFKRVNDEQGHDVGDQVLKALAAILARFFREQDLVARLGGEEFAVLMPGITSVECARRAEALRQRVAAEKVPLPGSGALVVTVSLGVASYPGGFDSHEAFSRAADQALYAAKHSGRNAVGVWDAGRAQVLPK